jgi:hypothetical protein
VRLTKFEKRIAPIAKRWHGVIPTWELAEHGIDGGQFRNWANHNPDVDHDSYGMYTWWDTPGEQWDYTHIARALAAAGPGAALWGPTVVDLMNLGTWQSQTLYIAVAGRRKSENGIVYVHDTGFPRIKLLGMPAQNPAAALESSQPYLDWDKWEEAVDAARERGILEKEPV